MKRTQVQIKKAARPSPPDDQETLTPSGKKLPIDRVVTPPTI